MWNQNSDNNKSKDVSVAETTNNFVDHEKSVVATSSSPSSIGSISGGNGKTTKTSKNSGGVGSGGASGGVGGGGSGESNNLGHCSTSKDKDNYTDTEGAIDSGFLSGPQLTGDYDDADFASENASANTRKSIPSVQLNIVNDKQQQKQQQANSDNYLDSGCIDEDFELDEVEQEQQQQRPAITTTAASPQQRAGQQQRQTNDNQMILEKGADSGVSEWFCKLTLRDPNQQVNNLGAGSSSGSETASWEIYYQQNNEGDTQLHLACMTGYVDVVAALIRMAPHPCLFNIQNDEAQTSLHLAVIYGQPKILRMLLIAGAEPTARDRHGNTPLHLACISGDTQCVKALTIHHSI